MCIYLPILGSRHVPVLNDVIFAANQHYVVHMQIRLACWVFLVYRVNYFSVKKVVYKTNYSGKLHQYCCEINCNFGNILSEKKFM